MSKTPINFKNIDKKSMAYLQSFVDARIAIAKEDMEHRSIIKPLEKELENIHKNRDNDLKNGLPLEDVLRKFPSIETDKAIRREKARHKAALLPLNKDLKDTYAFIPEGLYNAYVKKVEHGKRGDFMDCIREFLENIGIEEVSQSALGKLSENISDRLGMNVSNSKKLLEDGKFSFTLSDKQFAKLFMSVFCDILVQNAVIKMCL